MTETTHYKNDGKSFESLAVSPDNTVLAAAGDEGCVNIFKVCGLLRGRAAAALCAPCISIHGDGCWFF